MPGSREEGLNRLYPFNISQSTYATVSPEGFSVLSSKKGAALISAIIHPDKEALQKKGFAVYDANEAFEFASFILGETDEQFFYWFCDNYEKDVRLHGMDYAYIHAQKLYTPEVAAHYEPDARGFAGEHHNLHSAQAGHHCDYDRE